MTIRYKSATFDLTTTDKTTILTCPSDGTCLVKNIQASHESSGAVDVDLYLQKSGGSDVEISHAELNKNFTNMVSDTLALEASDVLKIQAGTANEITGVISYALIDRSQENG
jgi:hypothetical protein